MLPSKYNFLSIGVLPKMIQAGLKLLEKNTKEIKGAKDNPVIMDLAKQAGVSKIYPNDETSWCAVAHVALALEAGKEVGFTGYDRLRAASFSKWGNQVKEPMLGDTIVFSRPGGNHVAQYIAEDATTYHVMGGNQSDEYNITRIAKSRAIAFRRPIFKTGQPATVKKYLVSASGQVSQNEA